MVITQGEGVTTWHGACVHGESLLWDVASPAPLGSPGPSPACAFAWAFLCSQVVPRAQRPHPARQPCSGSSFPLKCYPCHPPSPEEAGPLQTPRTGLSPGFCPFVSGALVKRRDGPRPQFPHQENGGVACGSGWLSRQRPLRVPPLACPPGLLQRQQGPLRPGLDGEDRAPCGSGRPWALAGTACNTSALALRLPRDRWVIKGGK